MPTLPSDLRNKLERVVIEARDAAEIGARAALEALAVHHYEPYAPMKPAQRELRNHLRARARQLGDRKLPRADTSGKDHEISHLAGECAYEHWHRMLFARFLAENNLLIEPEENMAISLAEAEELAREEGVDVWEFASRCAQGMLPQIFRPDDPLLQITFATEHILKLEKLLASLPEAVFTASDALGWVYQFWQSKKKDEVNRSEVKIGADEIAAVTQLFTEPYMVEFLLHNTLGAWWAGRVAAASSRWSFCTTEEEGRQLCALPGLNWDYLRFIKVEAASNCLDQEKRQDAASTLRPAAGAFDGWPKSAKEIKGLDPCCGSGHFLVALFRHLVPIRMAEEDLSAREAVDAVLHDNIYGLEIDERCCQIAAFALALSAWTYPDAGGYRPLPELHIACTGIGPQATEEQWVKLAEQSGMPTQIDDSERVKNGLLNLYRLFSQAPMLGSLIDPKQLKADVFAAGYETIRPYLESVLKAEKADDETRERAIAAAGMVKAARLLADEYTIIITNVPYLGRPDQHSSLKDYCDVHHPTTKADLAACFMERGLSLCLSGGVFAAVMPLSVLLQPRYRGFRERSLKTESWAFVAPLGPHAFETIGGERVSVCLLGISHSSPGRENLIAGIDALQEPMPIGKATALITQDVRLPVQGDVMKNPDSRVVLEPLDSTQLLRSHAACIQGLATADDPQFTCDFWELSKINNGWEPLCGTVEATVPYGGRERLLHWDQGKGRYFRHAEALKAEGRLGGWKSGTEARGRLGVLVSQMSVMPVTLYRGEFYDHNASVLVVDDIAKLLAVWCYGSSDCFAAEVRKLDKSLKPSNNVFVQVPFSLPKWQKVAAEKYPDGLPEPESDDPTQWLFHGRPGGKVAEASSLWSDSAGVGKAYSRRVDQDQSQVGSATVGYFDPDQPIAHLTGDLPHWRQDGATYFVTFRCADALPQEKLDQWRREMGEWMASHPEPHDPATRRDFYERFPARMQAWLDAGCGLCPLRDEGNRRLVEAAIEHFQGERYEIVDRVVAANHVHVILSPLAGHQLSDILHSWKSYTANQLNRRLNSTGVFWQKESFDHLVRSPGSLEKFREYIGNHGAGQKVAAASSRRDNQRQDASATLQVAVARLLGYRWPAELDDKMRLSERARRLVKQCGELTKFADGDGIVCIPAVRGEEPAAERLLRLLAVCNIEPGVDLDDWLRTDFFEEHCKLFHDRPFVWHIWDGRKRDGFHALVNYHKLCESAGKGRRLLESLTYAYLGEWITRQKDGVKRGEEGAEDRLAAALELQKRLEAILSGEPPFDIFVRWKPLHEQPIGWEPDINDGVRLNIRPFLATDLSGGRTGAGILRYKPNIKWTKDRGKEPQRPKEDYPWFWGWDEKTEDFAGGKTFDGNRWNDCHYTNKAKQEARRKVKEEK